jgi:hypothetical protein
MRLHSHPKDREEHPMDLMASMPSKRRVLRQTHLPSHPPSWQPLARRPLFSWLLVRRSSLSHLFLSRPLLQQPLYRQPVRLQCLDSRHPNSSSNRVHWRLRLALRRPANVPRPQLPLPNLFVRHHQLLLPFQRISRKRLNSRLQMSCTGNSQLCLSGLCMPLLRPVVVTSRLPDVLSDSSLLRATKPLRGIYTLSSMGRSEQTDGPAVAL